MVLLLNCISAWIEVDGKELEQHGVEHDPDHNRAACWIAVQAGKCFSVVFKDDAVYREHTLASTLRLDGLDTGGRILRPPINPYNPVAVRTISQSSQTTSATSSRPFMFSKLELTDEDEYLTQASKHLGEIEICIQRVRPLQVSIHPGSNSTPIHAKVHERSKKAATHRVSYGEEVHTPVTYSCQTVPLDVIPLATFVFKYRDLGLLQADGIVPKPPPAEEKAIFSGEVLDLTVNYDVKSEPANDIKFVDKLAPSRKRKAVLTKWSNPTHDTEVKPAKRIKRENNLVPIGEVIDLT